MEFIFSFLGSLLGCLIFLYFIYPKQVTGKPKRETLEEKISHAKSGDTIYIKAVKPKGTILKAPSPEDERKRKAIEFERAVYERVRGT